MKIALIGYGKMGHMVEQAAENQGHEIVARLRSTKEITEAALANADICIDFSHPDFAVENIKQVMKLGKDLVMGTTGWYDHLEQVIGIVKRSQNGLLYSPNFSIGVQLFQQIVREAARVMNRFDIYDVGIHEAHHNKKADSPSGTAKALAKVVVNQVSRKRTIVEGPVTGQIAPEVLQIDSLRCGSIPGTHTVFFDSPADTITLTHQARNREGFALGAVAAAKWLRGRKGVYTVEDMMEV